MCGACDARTTPVRRQRARASSVGKTPSFSFCQVDMYALAMHNTEVQSKILDSKKTNSNSIHARKHLFLCGAGGDVYERWPASERKRSWSVCRLLETGSRQWIGQRTLFKLVGQGGLENQAQSGQDDSSSNIRQGNACVSLNARSTMNKKSELNIMVNDSDPHSIGITECWANKDITDAELEGYVMFRKDRTGRRGGGVLFLTSKIPRA